MAQAEDINPIERAEHADAAKRRERAGTDPNAKRYNDETYNWSRQATLYGLVAGVALGAYQFFLNIAEQGIAIGWGILGFLIFVPFIWYGLSQYRKHLAAGEVFKSGILFGLRVSVIGSIVAVALNGIGFLIGGEATPEVVGTEAISFGQLMVNSVFQVLIGIVVGMTITFIILQGIKSDAPADEFIEEQEGHA